VCHRTVSGAPGHSKPNSLPSGISKGAPLLFIGLSGVPAEQRLLRAQRSTATALNTLQCALESEHAREAHRTDYMTCPMHHRIAQRPHKSELQRSNPNGPLTWLAHRTVSGGAPDCPVRHATTHFQRPSFGGWGYKYPNHPTFNCIQVFTLLHLTRASIQYKTHQSDQILSQLHTKL
jgi:hypothetical protein